MRLFLLAFAIIVGIAAPAKAQQIVDESAKDVPESELQAMLRASMDHFREPEATKFRQLRFKQTRGQLNIRNEVITNDLICGKVNAKNQYGGYDGYKGFRYYTTDRTFHPGAAGC